MSFFVEDPGTAAETGEPERSVEPDPWDGPPEGEIPAVLPVAALLGATANAAMVLAGVRVFRTGIELSIEARLRRDELTEDDWNDLLDRTSGFGHRVRSRSSRSQPQIGIALADGRKVLADRPTSSGGAAAPEARLVRLGGSGSGSDRSWVSSWTFWLWPLPPDGGLTVVTAWPQLGLAETHTVVDGSDLAAIAGRVRPIWPDARPLHAGNQPSWSVTFGA